MSALKKPSRTALSYGDGDRGDVCSGAVELRPYEQDITAEAVRRLQEEADKDLAGEEWILVDGFEVTK